VHCLPWMTRLVMVDQGTLSSCRRHSDSLGC